MARYSAVFVFYHVLTRVSAGGWQFPRICACVGMGDMRAGGWRAALSSGPVTCDTFGPDSSSSSPACRCKSCKMHPTVPANFPHHRTCVDIMCHTFAKTPSSSSEFLQKGYEGVTPLIWSPPSLSAAFPRRPPILNHAAAFTRRGLPQAGWSPEFKPVCFSWKTGRVEPRI